MRKNVIEVLENNMPQSQKLLLSLFSLLDRLKLLTRVQNYEYVLGVTGVTKKDAVVRIIITSFG